jgi:cytochrome b6-f complex iron-sulfur subunit
MDRKEFLATLGFGTAAVVCAYCLNGCSSANPVDAPPTNVDFTLDLTASANAALKTIGGYIYNDRIIIAHINDGSYVALSQTCTHQGGTVQYVTNGNDFYCPNHGSRYATNGSVINGPATKSLQKYNTTLNGTSLRVFS